MNLHLELIDDIILARLHGEIDLAVSDSLRSSLEITLDQNPGTRNIIINLSKVNYIDSSGLGVLLGRYKRITKKGGNMFIVGATPQVRKIIEMSGLLTIMKEFSSEKDAINHAG